MGVDSAEFHIWQKGHADECDKNFDGTSGAMEMHAVLIMWRRSISDCQMRFVSMLSDGDSKTFQFLSDDKIYGSDIKIEKEECLNHIAKRLGTSLRNKVKEWKLKKVTLGGRKQGSLTDKNITKLQNYYRKAIKDNVPDTDKMKTAIYASLMHCSSTDKKPMHGKCPEGESSWCFYKRAIAKGETPGSHSSMRTYLSPQVVEKIMPVYQRLASDTILETSVAGKTQNSNKSLHSCIWRKCPKEVVLKNTMSLGDELRNSELRSSDTDETRALQTTPPRQLSDFEPLQISCCKSFRNNYNIWNSTREFLATDLVILNHGQVTRTTPEMPPPLLTTSPFQPEDV
ncbi:uncharacterized protein TNCV_2853751 [Trichonephila clavipes]|uniref:Mutator-like transposase domain-containing protein n=1 Tax=Trichonephila clavipes TaxID=2585209 RepID=A0A8X6RC74_TRICX|nr:uncharacterized protein TNCV_2853751 [Trichonephila clavipes]